ncbi:MAG: hypothetical protein WAO78_16660 [Roseovarius sp.]
MPKFNTNIELSIEDMDLIEAALRQTKAELSSKLIEAEAPTNEIEPERRVRKIHNLLGRLHNQKVFYRPSSTYVGG